MSVKYSPTSSLLLLVKTITHPSARSLCDSWATCLRLSNDSEGEMSWSLRAVPCRPCQSDQRRADGRITSASSSLQRASPRRARVIHCRHKTDSCYRSPTVSSRRRCRCRCSMMRDWTAWDRVYRKTFDSREVYCRRWYGTIWRSARCQNYL